MIDLNILEKGGDYNELKRAMSSLSAPLLEYIDGQAASDEFTRELDDAVQSVRRNEKWRLDSVKNKFFTRQICDCSPKFAG